MGHTFEKEKATSYVQRKLQIYTKVAFVNFEFGKKTLQVKHRDQKNSRKPKELGLQKTRKKYF